MFVDITKMFVL